MRFNAGTVSSPASKRITLGPPPRIAGLLASPSFRATGAVTPGNAIEKDSVLITSTSAVSVTDYVLQPQVFGGLGGSQIQWTSSNPDVGTVNDSGVVTYVSSGNTVITATLRDSEQSVELSLSASSGVVAKTLTNYVEGSLAHHIVGAIDSRLAGKDPVAAKPQFTTNNHANQIYVRNTACWASDVDLTAQSIWNSIGGQQRAGILISPCHLMVAAHYPLSVGATVRFLDAAGNVVNRTVVSVASNLIALYYPDFQVCRLDADVPAGVSFARVLPSNWESYLPSLSKVLQGNLYAFKTIPAIYINQHKRVGVVDWWVEAPTLVPGGFPHSMVAFQKAGFFDSLVPGKEQRNLFSEPSVSGDSGSAGTLLINGIQVVISLATYGSNPNGGGFSGTSVHFEKELVNGFMTALGGGYQLTEIDLSGFPTY
jgi:hypothetical protein